MCGRFAYPDETDVIATFSVEVVSAHKEPSADVRPTQPIRIVIEVAAAQTDDRRLVRQLRFARWGLVPSWTKNLDQRLLLINARSETVLSKPSFRSAALKRRALVPASGYYEWMRNPDGTKTAYFLHPGDDGVLGFAGLYEWWKAPEGVEVPGAEDGWLCSATIITRPALDSLGHIHDRMPVVVPVDMAGVWLDPDITSRDEVDALIAAMPDPTLVPTEKAPR